MEESWETRSEPSFCRELEHRAAVPWKLPLFQPESLSPLGLDLETLVVPIAQSAPSLQQAWHVAFDVLSTSLCTQQIPCA